MAEADRGEGDCDETPDVQVPAAAAALVGKYHGVTNSGGRICFEIVQAGTTQYFTNANFEQTTDCQPGARFRLTITFGGRVPVSAQNTFSYAVGTGELAGSRIDGSLDTQGARSGLAPHEGVLRLRGTRYTCESTTDWTATIQR